MTSQWLLISGIWESQMRSSTWLKKRTRKRWVEVDSGGKVEEVDRDKGEDEVAVGVALVGHEAVGVIAEAVEVAETIEEQNKMRN